MAAQPVAVLLANSFDPADQRRSLVFHALETGAAAERQFPFRRIEDLQHVAGDPPVDIAPDGLVDILQRLQEVAEHDDAAVTGQRFKPRQAARVIVIGGDRPVLKSLGEQQQRRAPGGRGNAPAQWRHMFAGADQKRGGGQHQKVRMIDLLRQAPIGCIAHAGRAVAPQPDALRRFPFVFTNVDRVRLGRAAPVDFLDRITGLVAPVLPKGLALADPAAAMHALGHRRRHPIRPDKKGRQVGSEQFRPLMKFRDRSAHPPGPPS